MQAVSAEKLDMQTLVDWLDMRPGQRLAVSATDVVSGVARGLRLRLAQDVGHHSMTILLDHYEMAPATGARIQPMLQLRLINREGSGLVPRQCRWRGRAIDLTQAGLDRLAGELARMARVMRGSRMPSLDGLLAAIDRSADQNQNAASANRC